MEKLIAFCRRWGWPILGIWFVLSVISGFSASHLRLNSELERLLPAHAKAVRNLARLEVAYGQQLDRFTLLIEGESPSENIAAVKELAAMLEKQDHVLTVEYKRPVEHFQKHRLLYMDVEDAEEISTQLEKRIKWEKRQANPLFVSVGKPKPPEVDFSKIEEKYKKLVGSQEYLANKEQTKFVVSAELDFASDDLKLTDELRDAVYPKIDKVRAAHKDVEITATGRYLKRIEQRDATVTDLGRGTSIAFALIFGFLLFYFRSIKPPMIVTIPLIAGTLVTFGTTYVTFKTLNILTGFVGSVLLGLGIDYGIHLAARYRIERSTRSVDDALVVAFRSSGKASLYAGLTTLIALGSLALSSFQAFHEFGLLALIGMTFVGLAYATLFPAIIILLDGTKLGLKASHDETHESEAWEEASLSRFKRVAIVLLLALIPAGAWGATQLEFEFDFYKLVPEGLPSIEADYRIANFIEVGRVPQVVLVEDKAHADAVVGELLRRKKEEENGELIDRTLTVFDLIPENQDRKAEIWKELLAEFDKIGEDIISDKEELSDFYKELQRIVEVGTIEQSELPHNLSRRFERLDDKNKTVVLVFPSRIIHDARDAITYSRLTEDLPGAKDGEKVDGIGEEPIMRDIVNDLRGDTIWMLLVTVLGIFIIALVAFRNVRRIAIVCATITVGVVVAAGLVGGFGVKFNFINLIILPIWLGLGVDAAFHMLVRLDEAPEDAGGFWHTVGAVLAAFGTTMIGFGGLMVSSHRGLNSLGQVAVIGLGAIFLISVAIQLLALQKKRAL